LAAHDGRKECPLTLWWLLNLSSGPMLITQNVWWPRRGRLLCPVALWWTLGLSGADTTTATFFMECNYNSFSSYLFIFNHIFRNTTQFFILKNISLNFIKRIYTLLLKFFVSSSFCCLFSKKYKKKINKQIKQKYTSKTQNQFSSFVISVHFFKWKAKISPKHINK
jgi:hypothetical protein